ncbi:secreted seminal-vesicle Ly-6 protein 1-like [Cricetulus griseus]|uniref:Prostate and testis expressed 9 n=1 Tax=Cricetulus griseus TaxID=10029 RepID=A0A8C2MVI9_CRIGR|nr:secreted seminal-vesicle Ly-6 protein 1-like [Cricetulus griseus]
MNLVTKMGPLLMATLSLLISVEALTCSQCTVFNTERICLYQQGSCETNNNQMCALWTASSGGRILYGFQECSHMCLNQTFFLGKMTLEMKCCQDKSFCNKF